MKQQIARCALTLLLTTATALGAQSDDIHWGNDLASAQATARQGNKLVMVDTYTDWCGWCKKLDQDVYTQPAVIAAAAQFVPVKVNAEKEGQDAAKKYKVTGYPTILFLDGAGALVDKIVGYQPADAFAASLGEVLKSYREFPQLESRARQNPDDAAAAQQYVAALLRRDRVGEAAALAAKLPPAATGSLGPLFNQIGQAYGEQGDVDHAVTCVPEDDR